MPALIQRYATPLITGIFIVSLVSGIALFFHVGQAYFHGMHEWLSMVLILPFVLHLWKNWRAMTTYFAKPAFAVAMGLSLVGGAVFAYLGSANSSGGPPQMALARMILANPPRGGSTAAQPLGRRPCRETCSGGLRSPGARTEPRRPRQGLRQVRHGTGRSAGPGPQLSDAGPMPSGAVQSCGYLQTADSC
jgi:hypothetical protein